MKDFERLSRERLAAPEKSVRQCQRITERLIFGLSLIGVVIVVVFCAAMILSFS